MRSNNLTMEKLRRQDMVNKGAVILAAGYSSRMKGFKPLLDVGGKTALERVIGALKESGLSNIVVVTGFQREMLKPFFDGISVHEAYNASYDTGMFSSIKEGIKKIRSIMGDNLEGFLLLPVDYAAVRSDAIIPLLLHEDAPNKLIVPCYKGKKGHPLWIPSAYIDEILLYDVAQGLKAITAKYEDEIIRIETGSESVVMDMDDRQGYEALLDYWNAGCVETDICTLAKGRRFFLVRHGQIVQHEKKIFLGQSDIPLSVYGEGQAKDAALKLEKIKPQTSVIYCSDLCRAAKTAQIILNTLDFDEIVYLRELREISLGSWDGQYIDDMKERYPDEFKKRGEKIISYKHDNNAENFYDLQYRTIKGVKNILKNDFKRDIIIVTHAGVIRILQTVLRGKELDESIFYHKIESGSVNVLEV